LAQLICRYFTPRCSHCSHCSHCWAKPSISRRA